MSESAKYKSGVKGWREQLDSDRLFKWALLLCPVCGFLLAGFSYAIWSSAVIALGVGVGATILAAAAVARWKDDAVHVLKELIDAFG